MGHPLEICLFRQPSDMAQVAENLWALAAEALRRTNGPPRHCAIACFQRAADRWSTIDHNECRVMDFNVARAH